MPAQICEAAMLTKRSRNLAPGGPGAFIWRAFLLIAVPIAAFMIVGLVSAAAEHPGVVALAVLFLAVWAVLWRKMWRLGIYETTEGLVYDRWFDRAHIAWDRAEKAEVDRVYFGFVKPRTVVVSTRDGDVVPLHLWNQWSFVMLGAPGGVDALADTINSAIARHQHG